MSGNTAPTLWYENSDGEQWFPPHRWGGEPPPPPGFEYQHYRNPFELRTSICTASGPIGSVGGTYSGELALALCRPSWRQRLMQLARYWWLSETMPLDVSILRAAGCERCMNTLAHRAGLSWGYRSGSAEDTTHTSCEFCRR